MAAETNWLADLLGQRIYIDGDEVLPTKKKWELFGVSATYNKTTDRVELTFGGGDFDQQPSARVATTANLTAGVIGNTLTAASNGSINSSGIDGLTDLAVGEIVLVKDQTAGEDNGLYAIDAVGDGSTPWSMTRVPSADVNAEVTPGLEVFVEEGTVNGQKSFRLTNTSTIIVNSTSLTFAARERLDYLELGDGTFPSAGAIRLGDSETELVIASHGTIPIRLEHSNQPAFHTEYASGAAADQYRIGLGGEPSSWETGEGLFFFRHGANVAPTAAPTDGLFALSLPTGGMSLWTVGGFQKFIAPDDPATATSKLSIEEVCEVGESLGGASATGHTVDLATNERVTIRVWAEMKRQTGTSDSASSEYIGTFKNIAGTVTQIGTTTNAFLHQDAGAAFGTLSFNISGTSVQIQVAGSGAGNNIDFELFIEVRRWRL